MKGLTFLAVVVFNTAPLLAAAAPPESTLSVEMLKAMELTPDIEHGKQRYALCATCHYEHGWGKQDGSFPSISGQHKSVIIKQISDFRARNRDNPTMFPFSDPATIGGPQALADVAEYIAQLPANPEPGTGPGDNLDIGATLFKEKCQLCHADDATGNEDFVFPRLQSQHYAYLERQMRWIRDGIRRNANPEMKKHLEAMSDEQISAVADHISRIRLD